MSDSIMQSQFIIELTNDQQESLAGGISLRDIVSSTFSEETLLFTTRSSSNRNGSEITQVVGASDIFTGAGQNLNLTL
ncbi:CTB family bacteriocin [Gloeocapsopsis crepidinum LEGE 06123]|uniref:CTB family bacteriocin n=1 Tax=Gloeocapsopsis crepidinum LEGE 06123 TaxID=588587 RepID=A0ABR9UVR3_9CHRO|nr:CTB family bacteriocin [Gloeocapsopsis crepidinum]MBE9192393.1 CTB family bacteriocin [Gloeocapsopsis crepidinum LEGE 06123]